jgi:L,D-transpeptidase ErfK/SrfK
MAFLRSLASPKRASASCALALLLLCGSLPACGATFPLPPAGSNVVGTLRVVKADSRNTLLDIARHYELGYEEITAANPGVSVWLPREGTPIVVPTEFILPPPPWEGIVVNVPQRRLYYFPRPSSSAPAIVVTFPIAIARPGWATPLGETSIVAKYANPSWTVPLDILDEHRNNGDVDFPDYFPPGPDNPLGMFALKTGFEQILIHGTNRPWGVGMRASHGCIRMYPENVADLFQQVPVGTPVRIVDQPVSVGRRGHLLYLSVAKPVGDYPGDQDSLLMRATDALIGYGAAENMLTIDWNHVRQAVKATRFFPVPISIGAPNLDKVLGSLNPEKYDFGPYGVEANGALPPNTLR